MVVFARGIARAFCLRDHPRLTGREQSRAHSRISGRKLEYSYVEDNRIGDHIWWVSDVRKFQSHFPAWQYRYGIPEILREIHDACIG